FGHPLDASRSRGNVDSLRAGLVLDLLDLDVGRTLEIGRRVVLLDGAARGHRFGELALVVERRTQVQEVLRLRHACDRLAELHARLGEPAALEQLLAFVVELRGDRGLTTITRWPWCWWW